MRWLRAQSPLGLIGQGWPGAAVTLAFGVVAIATSLGYDALNHGPTVLFLRTPIDDLIPRGRAVRPHLLAVADLTHECAGHPPQCQATGPR